MVKHVIIKNDFKSEGVEFKAGDRGDVLETSKREVTIQVKMNSWKDGDYNNGWWITADLDNVDIVEIE